MDRSPSSLLGKFFRRSIEQGLRWADRGAHRLLTHGCAVVTHVALHHLVDNRIVFRNSERTSKNAVGASDATGFERTLHDAIRRSFDRVGWANGGAGRVVAMHADDGCRLNRIATLDRFEMNHREACVGLAFRTGDYASIARNTSARVYIELTFAQEWILYLIYARRCLTCYDHDHSRFVLRDSC